MIILIYLQTLFPCMIFIINYNYYIIKHSHFEDKEDKGMTVKLKKIPLSLLLLRSLAEEQKHVWVPHFKLISFLSLFKIAELSNISITTLLYFTILPSKARHTCKFNYDALLFTYDSNAFKR